VADDPMKQFQVKTWVPIEIGGLDVSLTNAGFFMIATVLSITLFLVMAMGRRAMVPGRVQSVAELSYEFIANMLRSSAGTEGLRFFPLIFSIFMFVLIANLFGMVPFFFTVTSHIVVTFALAMLVITIVLLVGIIKNGFGFLKLFVPSGVPFWLMPLIVPIEVISFLTRPMSLAVRLFANMLAGHTMLKVFAGFVTSLSGLGALGVAGAILPLAAAVALTGLEFLVSFLQAYVFAILSCIYLNDALHPGHH